MIGQKLELIRKIPVSSEKLGTLSDIEKMLRRNIICPKCETIHMNSYVPRCTECGYNL